jgi:hypothetical protein
MTTMRAVALILLAGCTTTPEPQTFEIQPRLPTPLDILIVLDDTTAMASHLPRPDPANVGGVLILMYNGAPDVRFAVTTTTTGTLRTSPAVPTGIIEHAINFEDGTLDTNYQGTIANALSSLMNVGTASTAPNAIFASTESALATNFVRASAGVGLFVVSATDDQSPGDVATHIDAVRARPNEVMLSWLSPEGMLRLTAFADGLAYRYYTPIDAYGMQAVMPFTWLWHDEPLDFCFPIDAATDCEMHMSHNHIVTPLDECLGDPWQADVPCWQLSPANECASGRLIGFGGPFRHYHPRVIGRCFP